MIMWTRMSSAVALATIAAAGLAAQQPQAPQAPTFKSGTQIVSLFVTVADADKRLVPDLTKDDFEVFDNDKPQPIVYFDNGIHPITVIVMLDTSGSMTGTIGLLRQAAEQFIIRLLPDDKGRVGAFNDKIQFSARFTSDRDELVTDVKELDYGNGTRLWDAVGASLDELRGIEGRRVILVFTDGDDTESKTMSLGKVIERARADEVMIYAIGLESNYFNGQRMVRSKPDSGLRKIADETGGGYFELTKTADLAPTFTRVAYELHSQYVIGFSPTQLDNRVHKLAVKMKKPGLTARARRSYVAAPDKFTVGDR
ncbi:MAG: VWA domain-containing protein [Acidobacteria bacterium]|nr:VWA domain-containing protein [Acidobacteriota bacterium]